MQISTVTCDRCGQDTGTRNYYKFETMESAPPGCSLPDYAQSRVTARMNPRIDICYNCAKQLVAWFGKNIEGMPQVEEKK